MRRQSFVGIIVGVMIMGMTYQQWDCNMDLIPEHDRENHIPSTELRNSPVVSVTSVFWAFLCAGPTEIGVSSC